MPNQQYNNARKQAQRISQQQLRDRIMAQHKPTPIGEDLANLAVTTVGGIGDLAQMGGDVLAHLLVARSPEVPFTTERLREKYDVREAERGQLFLDLLAPGPAEIVKAGSLGMMGIRNLGKVDVLEEAQSLIQKGHDKLDVFRKTGMYEDGTDGWKYWKTDRDLSLKMDALEDPKFLDAFTGDKAGEYKIGWAMEDILDDPELFEAYPQIRRHRINVTATRHADGSVTLGGGGGGARGSFNTKTKEITAFGNNLQDIRSTVLHEIQHMTDMIEGLSSGSNTAPYYKLIDDWEDSVIEERLIQKFSRGELDADDFYRDSLPDTGKQAVVDVMNSIHPDIKPGTEQFDGFQRSVNKLAREIAGDIAEFGAPVEDLVQQAANVRQRNMNRVRTLFNELEDNGLVTPEEITRVIQSGPRGMREMAFQRYYNNAGEIRARIAQQVDKQNLALEEFVRVPETASGARKGGVPFDD